MDNRPCRGHHFIMKTIYRCTVCGVEDSDRSTAPPSNLICYKSDCRVRSRNNPRSVEERDAMFPVDAAGYYPWGELAPKYPL